MIAPASLSSLRRGLRRWAAANELFGYATVAFVDEPAAKVAKNPDKWNREQVELKFWNALGKEEFSLWVLTFGDPDDGLPSGAKVEKFLAPFLRTYNATATVGVDDDEYDYGGLYQLAVEITFPVRGRTVGYAYELGKGVLALLDAAEAGGSLSRQTALGILRGGRPDVLIGQPETDWIDFKRQAYPKDEHGKFELAKDVAAFANADGGIIILGVATTKAGHVESASKILPLGAGTVSAQSYRAVLTHRIHPPPAGIEIFAVPTHGGELWVVSIPPQPPELKPFLVHGAVIDSKVNSFFQSSLARTTKPSPRILKRCTPPLLPAKQAHNTRAERTRFHRRSASRSRPLVRARIPGRAASRTPRTATPPGQRPRSTATPARER